MSDPLYPSPSLLPSPTLLPEGPARGERILSPLAQLCLSHLPSYYENDPFTQAVINAVARELERFEAARASIERGFFPVFASNAYRMLGIWELIYGLPIEPNASDAQRTAALLAKIQGRRSASGSDWVANVTAALGTSNWTHQEDFPSAGFLTVTIPFSTTSYSAGLARTFIQETAPAHLELIVNYDAGFIVGVSEVGEEAL